MNIPIKKRVGSWLLDALIFGAHAAVILAADSAATNRPPAQVGGVASPLDGDSYQPNPQDKFQFRIEEDPNKGADFEIRNVSALFDLQFNASRGTDTPITINARGKTLGAIKKELKAKLDLDFYQNATVVLKLLEPHQRAGRVFITGTLKGQVPLLPAETKTVMQAILELGGDTEYSNLKKVKLYRLNPTTNKEDSFVIDVGSMLKGGARDNNMILQDGDRIFVPEKGIIFN